MRMFIIAPGTNEVLFTRFSLLNGKKRGMSEEQSRQIISRVAFCCAEVKASSPSAHLIKSQVRIMKRVSNIARGLLKTHRPSIWFHQGDQSDTGFYS